MMEKWWLISVAVGFLIAGDCFSIANDNPWYSKGQEKLESLKNAPPVNTKAKNIILFLGDGMGISTQTAARIYAGQKRGEPGEENFLSFETLPYSALIKTYNTDQQVPDSAGTMTAIMTGVKTNAGVVSYDHQVKRGHCHSPHRHKAESLLEKAEIAGFATGIVTTARVTHATPAATYAHSPERNWEDDQKLPAEAREKGCKDIASQLVEFSKGDGIEVVLGGGRGHFLPNTVKDPEYDQYGWRGDGRNLISGWLSRYPGGAFVWNKDQLEDIDDQKVRKLFGLFEPSHMQYEHDRVTSDPIQDPSIALMTKKALGILSTHKKGYFLMVESGRIDHAHHANNAYRALEDTVAFEQAVRYAMDHTDPKETLIIVTADHSHVFTMAGYPARGQPILGLVRGQNGEAHRDALGLPYTTLSYANGPGYIGASDVQEGGLKSYPHDPGKYLTYADSGRPDLTHADPLAHDFMQESGIPMTSETHAGEDVGLFARGPNAHLFRGVMEQNVIFHIMQDALDLQ